MKITGKLEVFKNQRGYITGILKAFDKDKNLTGKIFIDVKGLDIKDDRTYTINVIDGYLNVIHQESLTKDFDKLSISVLKHKLLSVYPEKEGDKEVIDEVTESETCSESTQEDEETDDLPF